MKPIFRALLLVAALLVPTHRLWSADSRFTPPASPRVTYNFNAGWKFMRAEVPGAQEVSFDDSKWETVSTPHAFNDVDSFRVIIDHSSGDRGTYKGISWYRKHFKLPADAAGSKVFIEFEGMRQAGEIYLNGRPFGLYENGVTAYGVDITSGIQFGDHDNVLAVRVDNTTTYHERATDVPFRWNANDFNPDFGGINRRVWLHVTGKIYQTLPLYYGLGTTGTYIYCTNYNIAGRSCDVTVESQVHNANTDRRIPDSKVTLSATVVDKEGNVRATFTGTEVDILQGAKTVLTATGPLTNARFWSPDEPNLYDVYTTLTVDGKVVDVTKTTTGFRKTEFKGGVGTGGVYINDKFVYLKGFSERSADEWAGVGAGYPEWIGGMRADGEDIALIDFEVVDAKGERCPTDDARVDFTMDATSTVGTSPAIWRGGYNSGKTDTTNNLYLNTEDGINRVAIRSTLTPGTIKVTATRDGLKPATVTFTSSPVAITDGLSQEVQVTLSPFATK
jgi:beta-galactosidase